MKLLILSSNNGQGHNSASRALIEAAEKRGITAIMIDNMIFDSPAMSDLQKNFYIQTALKTPKLLEGGVKIVAKLEKADSKTRLISKFQRTTMVNEVTHLRRFIDANGFDTVVAAMVFPAAAMSFIKEQAGDRITTAFLVTDYSYTPLTSETSLDLYCLPHVNVLPDYRKNAPGKRYVVTGIPTSEKVHMKMGKKEARKKLGLPDKDPVLLIMTGSMGFGKIVPLIRKLKKEAPEGTRILSLCGNNTKLIASINKAFPEDPHVSAISFTNEVPTYMSAADVLITKPGGLSTTEAASLEIPLVLINPISTWEEDNVRLFTATGMARSGRDLSEMSQAAVELLKDPEACRKMMLCQHYEINKNAADTLLDELVKLREEQQEADRRSWESDPGRR